MTKKPAGRPPEAFESTYTPTQEIEHLRAQVSQLEGRLRSERDATGEARLITLALTEAISAAEPPKMIYKPSKADGEPITYVLHLTDLHNGEVTKKDEVDGFGEFNPEVFNRRLRQLGQHVIDHVAVQRAGYKIPTLHIMGTGDYISGDIHEELKVTNAYPAPVQAVNCGYALGALVEMLAPHFEQINSDWITCDNHGRMTKKNQAAEGGENNWGFVVAHIIKQYTARLSNFCMNIHAKASAIAPIGSKEKFLIFHGHQIKGWAGVPYYGFERRVALEAVKRMNAQDSGFTKLLFGHFHISVDSQNFLTGGSLSGTNAFDHSCGRHSPAHQTSFMVHPKHGQFAFSRWWL
jgi:hypothetical protein